MDAPPIQYVTTSDGWRIAYAVRGAGLPLVYMPSGVSHIELDWLESSHYCAALVAFAEHFRLIQYDPRGQGLSDRGLPDGLTLEDCLLDLDAVLETTGIGRFILV